jgi:transposase
LLLTVPGISTQLTAIRILAEIGADMSVFETAKQLTSWAELTPQNQESASKKAVIAIARKLLTAIWHVLSQNETYNADLYRKADKPPVVRELTIRLRLLHSCVARVL